ncbi:hypothetical protein ACLOJK_041259 [Asimina triloba]
MQCLRALSRILPIQTRPLLMKNLCALRTRIKIGQSSWTGLTQIKSPDNEFKPRIALGEDMDPSSLSTQSKHEGEMGFYSGSSPSPSSSSDISHDSISSSLSDSTEEVTSSDSGGSLYQMSSLMEQLPFKRGLSKHFQGKSQSFTSLANARCLEDLVKPENPYNKKLKSCKSYGGGLDIHKPHSPKASSRAISKRTSRGSFSSTSLVNARRNGCLGNRPPVPPHRSSSLSNQTPLFA